MIKFVSPVSQCHQEQVISGGLTAAPQLVKAGSHGGGLETPRVAGVQGAGLDSPWSPSLVMAPETPRDDPMVQ